MTALDRGDELASISLLRRLRANCEERMTPAFDLSLSLEIDHLVQQEETAHDRRLRN